MSKSKKLKTNIKSLPDIGGYHPDGSQAKWPMGSIFANEGQRLYELVRKLKPKRIVEIGGYYGCSTTWLAQAVHDNGFGKVISIDNNSHHGEWSKVPQRLKQYIEFNVNDALTCKVPQDIDMIFEDGEHSPGFTKTIAQRFKPKMVFVSHDFEHDSEVGKNVRNDFLEIFGEPDEVFFEPPSDCGLAIKFCCEKWSLKNFIHQ